MARPAGASNAEGRFVSAVVSTASNVRRDLPMNFFIERYIKSYVAEVAAFVAAIADDQPVPVTGADGRAPVVIGLAVRRSYDEHRPVLIEEIGTVSHVSREP
jgi:myo-inositol 2-dehydrogenase/D-chiro-inositol 1-dehydrogenase